MQRCISSLFFIALLGIGIGVGLLISTFSNETTQSNEISQSNEANIEDEGEQTINDLLIATL